MSKLGDQFFGALLHSGQVESYLKLGSLDAIFNYEDSDATHFKWVDDFVQKYGKLPSLETARDEMLWEPENPPETINFYHAKLMDRHIHRSLIKAGTEVNVFIENGELSKALEVMSNVCTRLQMEQNRASIYDFRMAYPVVTKEMKAKLVEGYSILLGWPTFDKINGGLRPGDLVSIVGRPQQGKSYQMLSRALHVWRTTKRPVIFVSMEMSPILVFERLAALYTHVPADWIKMGSIPTLHTTAKKKFEESLLALQSEDAPFYVVDGNLSATVFDLNSLCHQLNPCAVFVDGAYMLQHPNKRLGKYEKVAENTGLLKQVIATERRVPVIASWQFNREATKKKKAEIPNLEDIAYSDEIGQLSSVVLGLFQEENVESILKKRIDVLKGRSGEVGSFYTFWDFQTMNFEEIVSPEIWSISVD
jgi:replicative DNA helicase